MKSERRTSSVENSVVEQVSIEGDFQKSEARVTQVVVDNKSLSTDSLITVRLSTIDKSVPLSDSPSDTYPAFHASTEVDNSTMTYALQDGTILGTSTACKDSKKLEVDQEALFERDTAIMQITEEALEEPSYGSPNNSNRSRSNSSGTSLSDGSTHVDWDELEKSEEQEPRDEGSDESTAFLLARLEQENNALATDPKSGIKPTRGKRQSRPPSIHHLKRLVTSPTSPSLRYSLLPAPPAMTELEFWAALVADYPQTAQRLPTLTSNKIRSGIPPPLRGVVWMSMAGARDRLLEEQYERLLGESSPYENLIGKDIGRTFPGVEMFRDPEGEGQRMLGRVLKCFSLYDQRIGYCQGLGFLVGPLLLNMGEKEAFCVLVRLMEHYDLRSCFLPDLSGLHLRIFQFQHLLTQHLPSLAAHLENLQVQPAYVSQWFLSFFAVACPLPMLLRIYDVIFAEGTSETTMRVALSLMRRNETKLLACSEFEDVMQLLLSRGLWDTYACDADDLVNDFVGLTGLVTHDGLQALEYSFRVAQHEGSAAKIGSPPDLQAAASRFLGRFWAGSHAHSKSASLSPGLTTASRPMSFLRRSPSKQSLASTLNSAECGSESGVSSAVTEATTMSRLPSADCSSLKSNANSTMFTTSPIQKALSSKDKDLHSQIEDLLTALVDMQRKQAILTDELQKEREEREEDQQMVRSLIGQMKGSGSLDNAEETRFAATADAELVSEGADASAPMLSPEDYLSGLLEKAEQHFSITIDRRKSAIVETKQQLREVVRKSKEQHTLDIERLQDLDRRLVDQTQENSTLNEQLKEARSRIQDGHREKQRLEKSIQELRARKPSLASSLSSADNPPISNISGQGSRQSVHGGLRDLRLGKTDSMRSQTAPSFSKRTSSLNTQAILTTDNHQPPAEDALLLELVNAKTAEAVAKQELEEVKGKLEALRRMLGSNGVTSVGTVAHRPTPSEPSIERSATLSSFTSYMNSGPGKTPEAPKITPPSTSTGGFWGGWGKRSFSNSGLSEL
ncbi:MAG: hypothetical protein M1827_005662 [Pycnora praestabilis]|nr:MAG: hypothetical protein M1827_005662 [Pycnora praestabilis]